MSFEQAAKRIGSLPVNLIRLGLALFFYCILSLIRSGHPFPVGFSTSSWLWLIMSGLVGFVLGDYCLFSAYAIIGSRVTNLFMALAPPMATLLGSLMLKETFSFQGVAGMLVTLSGIVLVVMRKHGSNSGMRFSLKGVLFGLGAAVGQAVGLVFSKQGMQGGDPFIASQIRVIAGFTGFMILFAALNKWKTLKPAFQRTSTLAFITSGSFFGPFLGVSFSLMAIKFTTTGIASTIMALTPVFLIPPAYFLLKEKISWRDILGALLAVGGVALFFL